MDVYCANSTLREAHVGVAGLPGPIDKNEFALLRARFAREWPGGQVASLRAVVPEDVETPDLTQDLPPQWFGQMTWDDGRWVSRWGHRTLSLHRVIVDGDRYTKFSRTVLPTLTVWLAAAREAYAFGGADPDVATVVFGYVNVLELPARENLADWFRISYGIDAAGVKDGLDGVALTARIPRPEFHARATVHLSADQGEATIRVSVNTLVERDVPVGTRFSAEQILLAEVGQAKALARETFFSFVTERTLRHMEATDAEPET